MIEIDPPAPADLEPLLAFFARVPASERTFFKEPVLDAGTVRSWLEAGSGRRGLARAGGDVAGYVAIVPLGGWSDHVGEIRLVVHPERRGQGLGRALARWALLQAIELGLAKLFVEVVADQTGAVAMFQSLGFQAEGLLRDHVRDGDDVLRDLVLLAHPVAEGWSAMHAAGIDDALTG